MHLSGANFRSPGFYLAQSHAPCASCRQFSRVTALALPEGHEALVEGRWQLAEANAFLFFITELPAPIGRRLAQKAPLFSRKQGEGNRNPYWTNHCEHCGAAFSDDDLHCEPGVFIPMEPRDAAAVTLAFVAEEFSAAAGGYAFDPQFFDLMVRP
jgi:hypothetical protein